MHLGRSSLYPRHEVDNGCANFCRITDACDKLSAKAAVSWDSAEAAGVGKIDKYWMGSSWLWLCWRSSG